MQNRFIESSHILLQYELKEGTKTSYYQKAGAKGIFPSRLSVGNYAQRKPSKQDNAKKTEINGQYKKDESGLYKQLNERKIHSSIWEAQDFPEFFGYGILDERHQVYDLLILESENNLASSFKLHIFRGMGKPQYLQEAFQYLRNKKPQ